MKTIKIFIILIVLLLGVFVYYKSQEKHSIQKIDTPQQQKSFTPKPKDIIVEKKVQNKKEKTIYISREINTTIKTQIILKSNFDKNSKEYNYIWKKGKNIIGVGKDTIQRSFSLGEHNISCQIFDDNSLISQENIRVIAWKYIKEESYYFSTYTDKYELGGTRFFDYLNRLILDFTNYDKKTYIYNDNNQIVEKRYEYFNFPDENYIITYVYDGNKTISMEKVNNNGDIIESHIYDEEGNEIEQEYNSQEEDIPEETPKNDTIKKEPIKIYNKDGNLTHIETVNGLYQKNLKYENGRVVYQETIYPNGRNSKSIKYDSKGRDIYIEYQYRDKEDNIRGKDIIKKEYDKEGNLIKKERKYSKKGEVIQHTIEQWSYKNGKKLLHRMEALVGVCPCTANLVKEETIYHYDKDGNLTSSDYKYQKKDDDKFIKSKDNKKVRTYTNELEEH